MRTSLTTRRVTLHALELAIVSATFLVCAAPASAQVRAEDKAAAQVLFDDGRKLLSEERFVEACAKFQESQRLDPGLGTMLYLADCLERSGRTASAWATFLEAASIAGKTGETRRKEIAEVRARNLEPKLARVTIRVPESARVKDLKIARNGESVWQASWGVALPVDPGVQEIVVSAPGRETWSTKLSVLESAQGAVDVPVLKQAPQTAAPPSRTPSAAPMATAPPPGAAKPPKEEERSALPYILGAGGVIGLGLGSYFGLQAMTRNDESKEVCRTETLCSPNGVTLREDAQEAGTISTIAFIAGGALLASGIVLYVLPDADSETGARRHFYVAGGLGAGPSVEIGGQF